MKDFIPTGDALEDLRERSLRHAEKAAVLTARAEAHKHLSAVFRVQADAAEPDHEPDIYEDLIDHLAGNLPDQTIIMEPWGEDGHALIHPGYVDRLAAAMAALVEIGQLAGPDTVSDILTEGPINLLRRTQHIILPAEADEDEGPWNLQPYTVFWLGRYEDIPPSVSEIVHGTGATALEADPFG